MSTRSTEVMFLGSKAKAGAYKADNLTATFEPTVYTVWDP
jgi:hypothetical protein